jgi:hypothetical protein
MRQSIGFDTKRLKVEGYGLRHVWRNRTGTHVITAREFRERRALTLNMIEGLRKIAWDGGQSSPIPSTTLGLIPCGRRMPQSAHPASTRCRDGRDEASLGEAFLLTEKFPGNQIEHKLFGSLANQLLGNFVNFIMSVIEYYLSRRCGLGRR